jgi:predicted  nucleic acid-binding Zn-ribbon protein
MEQTKGIVEQSEQQMADALEAKKKEMTLQITSFMTTRDEMNEVDQKIKSLREEIDSKNDTMEAERNLLEDLTARLEKEVQKNRDINEKDRLLLKMQKIGNE